MKNLTLKIATSIALLTSGLVTLNASEDYTKLDEKKECSVTANGVEKVIATAAKYNAIAVEKKIEFMRLGMKNSQYIEAVEAAVKSGAKNIDIIDKAKKKTGEMTVEAAADRACRFAIGALAQYSEAKTTWRLAVPGDGYNY